MARKGAQGLYDVKGDLTTLGKIIGGGMPVGAFGGRTEVMDCLAPDGGVYQAGTLSGNPVAMAAGLVTLQKVNGDSFYQSLEKMTEKLVTGLMEKAAVAGIPMLANHVGPMFGLFFTDQEKVTCFDEVMNCNGDRFNAFFHGMLDRGIYLAPSAFEAGFISSAHTEEDIQRTIEAAEQVFFDIIIACVLE